MLVTNTPLWGLALEVIGRQGSIALMRGADVIDARSLSEDGRAASTLIPAVQMMLAESLRAPTSGRPDYVAVAIGPGSFTGLRIAVTAAKTLAFAWEVPLIAVDSLAAIAELAAINATSQSPETRVLVGLTAYRRQVFRGRFRVLPANEVDATHAKNPAISESGPIELIGAEDWKREIATLLAEPKGVAPEQIGTSTPWILAGDRSAFEQITGFAAIGGSGEYAGIGQPKGTGQPEGIGQPEGAGALASSSPLIRWAEEDPDQPRAVGVGRLAANVVASGVPKSLATRWGRVVSAIDAAPLYFRPSSAEEKSGIVPG